jgi:hypothetical protein
MQLWLAAELSILVIKRYFVLLALVDANYHFIAVDIVSKAKNRTSVSLSNEVWNIFGSENAKHN